MTGPNRPEPLDPAERALADALARQPVAPGPSPSLDAAILAAARAAARARAAGPRASARDDSVAAPAIRRTPATGQRPRRRHPAWLRGGALAATVAIAAGIAWQLQPRFDAPQLADEAGTPVIPAADAGAAREAMGRSPGMAPAPALRTPPADAVEPARATGQASAPASTPASPPATAARASEEPPVVFDAPVPTAAPMVPAPPLPAPPAPPAPPPAPPPAQQGAYGEAAKRRASPVPATASPAERRHATAVEDPHEDWLDQPLDDMPPASVDSPAVREAWLARIRELVSAERYDEARDSYAEFRRRHPDAPVPPDLRALLGGE